MIKRFKAIDGVHQKRKVWSGYTWWI